ncbi:hypothetical protein [Aliarcobacter cryaerophilus]
MAKDLDIYPKTLYDWVTAYKKSIICQLEI